MKAQIKYSVVTIDPQIKGDFSFSKKWDYPWDVFKDEHTGKFEKNAGGRIRHNDTAHLFYTAQCTTNVQGGYRIRYCYADVENDEIRLSFSDGLPAYASKFTVYIKNDSFCFKPLTVYPAPTYTERKTYLITKQGLTLNKSKYTTADKIIGYVDIEFTEMSAAAGRQTEEHNYYLHGFISTKIKNMSAVNKHK